MYDIDSATAPVGRAAGDDRDGVVIRVVKDLDLQSLARPVQLTHRVQDALGDVALVVDRHLDADHWLVAASERRNQVRPEAGRSPGEVEDVRAKPEEGQAGQSDDADGDRSHRFQPGPSNSVEGRIVARTYATRASASGLSRRVHCM